MILANWNDKDKCWVVRGERKNKRKKKKDGAEPVIPYQVPTFMLYRCIPLLVLSHSKRTPCAYITQLAYRGAICRTVLLLFICQV